MQTRRHIQPLLPIHHIALAAVLAVTAIRSPLSAQAMDMSMPRMTVPIPHPERYVDAARRATVGLDTPEAARAAGYVPVFGNVPLQGEHFARPDLVMRDSFDIDHPSVLMFASVGGRSTLVGVAYTFFLPVGQTQPRGWEGPADVWHSHDDLLHLPGKHIVMMHTWLVDCPEGALGHVNSWLPYYAASLAPPPADADSAGADLARRLGLALGLATNPPGVIDQIQRQADGAVAARTAALRTEILALVPRLRAAQANGDAGAFEALRVQTAATGDTLVAAYRQGSGSPEVLASLNIVLGMYLGNEAAPRR